MNKEILEKLKLKFTNIGDNVITGNEALKIIDDVFSESFLPNEIIEAQKYITACHLDFGFMGSPKYYEMKKIVVDYFNKIDEK